jgi:Flp pilus assembly protein TadG
MRRGRGEEGLTATQLAIVMPALLFFIMLIVQYGLWFQAKQVASAAAAEAVDAAQVPDGLSSDGERAARSFLAQSGNLRDVVVEVERSADQVVARVRGRAPQLVPGIAWTVASQVQSPAERFVPEPER